MAVRVFDGETFRLGGCVEVEVGGDNGSSRESAGRAHQIQLHGCRKLHAVIGSKLVPFDKCDS